MPEDATPSLSPIGFLQTFVAQSLRTAGQMGCSECAPGIGYIESIGLTAGPCFERICRGQLDLQGDIDLDQYADIILAIKNQIGGSFARASSDPGVVRVVNTQCPFGDVVKQAPELCRMTSSVFGGIAARNFGYAKVELRKRIAVGDGRCEVCVHTNAASAQDQPGDEYRYEQGMLVSQPAYAAATLQVDAERPHPWCGIGGSESKVPDKPNIVAESEAMRAALDAVDRVAPTPATVLVSGETGVGKEVIARALHALSRRSGDFVAVNCGAIPADLVESALFGHEKGAFTGAYDVHHGFFERAGRGTLFLDEIDSLSLSAQSKLLRVLQEGEYDRVGGRQTLRADVRVVAASNRQIEDAVAAGEFRSDLYYRLNVVPILIPPLRERREDINPLAQYFLRRIADQYGGRRKVLGERAWAQAMTYGWPGNVRELENVLERGFLFAKGPVIETLSIASGPDAGGLERDRFRLRELTREAAMRTEAELIRSALRDLRGNVSAVARQMGITPRAVHQKLRKHAIVAAEFRGSR